MAKTDSNGNPYRKSRGLGKRGGEVADWHRADASLCVTAICAAAAQGGAIRFGYTSDGGAFAVGIYGDGAPYTEYIPPSGDINATLQDVIDLFESIGDDNASIEKTKKT